MTAPNRYAESSLVRKQHLHITSSLLRAKAA